MRRVTKLFIFLYATAAVTGSALAQNTAGRNSSEANEYDSDFSRICVCICIRIFDFHTRSNVRPRGVPDHHRVYFSTFRRIYCCLNAQKIFLTVELVPGVIKVERTLKPVHVTPVPHV